MYTRVSTCFLYLHGYLDSQILKWRKSVCVCERERERERARKFPVRIFIYLSTETRPHGFSSFVNFHIDRSFYTRFSIDLLNLRARGSTKKRHLLIKLWLKSVSSVHSTGSVLTRELTYSRFWSCSFLFLISLLARNLRRMRFAWMFTFQAKPSDRWRYN